MSVDKRWPENIDSRTKDGDDHQANPDQESSGISEPNMCRDEGFIDLESRIEGVHGGVETILDEPNNKQHLSYIQTTSMMSRFQNCSVLLLF